MRSKLLLLSTIALILPICVAAENQTPQIPASQLDKIQITVGPLKFRITRLRGSVLKIGNGQIELEVENASSEFQTFYPQRISLINKDNSQLNTILARTTNYRTSLPPYDPRIPSALTDRRIAPGARVKDIYGLTGKVRLPARLFYDEKLIAVITE